MIEFLQKNWEVIVGIAGTAIAWIGGRELKRVEQKSREASALSELQNVYDRYLEHDRKRMDEVLSRVKSLEAELIQMRSESIMQRKENLELQEQIRGWAMKYSTLEKKYTDLQNAHQKLKKEFENYKKKSK